ncbi:glucose inhibited division protein B, putative [Oceanicaulis sp. HTCC2633]|uniref:16S rRNA (guanine(527)-N(7))-methyltransferase RsmG n=1 Tax=Oceanicaulis sp. HTCC2633 TaxID=314254 RepID=UPI0000669768|nr:16S rRNA (guanine(527)-N(7))-methyltransferase RsmG [Oceanicaulis sp. HTCC2633]EAP89608.1 glucose inhibited division protein B, putative [Oceanicaulis sp. HTCC2633]
MSETAYGPEQFQAETGVSRETLERFETWRRLLEETSAHTNLVGRGTLTEFWHRHALDSWQVFELMPEARRWADLGAGAGFPGLAIAFALMERHAGKGHVLMVDSVAKKMAFVNQVIRETKAPAIARADRVESIHPVPEVDVVTARAMAPLGKLLGYVHPFVDKGAVALLPKGARYKEELTEARKSWTFEAEVLPSRTSPEAAILKIRGLARV